MKAMNNFLRNMDWTSLFLALLILSLISLTAGCSHKTTISEGNLYLQSQAQQVQIDSYRSQLQATKLKLTQVIPSLQNKNPRLPASLLTELTVFLATNDCIAQTGELQEQCYRLTLVRLIETTRALDASNANVYAGQKTVNKLVDNINVLVDSLTDPNGTGVSVKLKPK